MGGRGSGSGSDPTDPKPPNDPNNPNNPDDPADEEDPKDWDWNELQEYILRNLETDDAAALSKARQWLETHRLPDTVTLQDDYMTAPETFYRLITTSGVELLYTAGNEANAADTLLELAAGYDRLPSALKDRITRIVMSTQTHEDAAATAGTPDNNIVFYRGSPITTGTLAHEAAHNFAARRWVDDSGVPPDNAYADAVNSGEPPVSDYARTHLQEDFAESVRLYTTHRAQLQQTAPLRYAVIHRLMNDPDYYGY